MSNATQVTMTDQFVDDLLTAKPESLADTSTAVWLIRELAREVQRLRKLAPWHDKPQIEITGGPFEGWKGRLHQDDTHFAKVVLGTEDTGMMIALLIRSIEKSHIKHITQESA